MLSITLNSKASIAWTRVHAIFIKTRAEKKGFKLNLTPTMKPDGSSPRNRLDTSRWFDLHRTGETWARRGSWPRIVGETWTHEGHLIFIERLSMKEIVERVVGHDSHSLARSDGTYSIARWSSLICRGKLHGDRGLIEPRSWLIHGAIVAHDHLTLVGHDFHENVATNRHPIADQTAQIFRAKIPIKTNVLLCFHELSIDS